MKIKVEAQLLKKDELAQKQVHQYLQQQSEMRKQLEIEEKEELDRQSESESPSKTVMNS